MMFDQIVAALLYTPALDISHGTQEGRGTKSSPSSLAHSSVGSGIGNTMLNEVSFVVCLCFFLEHCDCREVHPGSDESHAGPQRLF